MSITSINGNNCYKLTLRSTSEFFAEKLPSAGGMFSELVKEIACDILWISDMFPQGYLYKPLSFDMIPISSDEEYRVLKKVKAARYVDTDFFKKQRRKQNIIEGILAGDYVQEEGCLKNAYDKKPVGMKKGVHPEFENPIVFCIEADAAFDIYIAGEADLKNRLNVGRKLLLAGNTFELVRLEEIAKREGGRAMLLTDCPVAGNIDVHSDSDSIFRLIVQGPDKQQYVKAGSVLDIRDCVGEAHSGFYPYLFWMEV